MATVRGTLEYFYEMAIANSLQNTAAASKLSPALGVLDGIIDDTNIEDISLWDRVAICKAGDEIAYGNERLRQAISVYRKPN